jgi:hypothetical protein
MPPVQKTAPALPPKLIGFRAALDATARLDAAAGTIAGIAIVTGNLQPLGWPMWVDQTSLATFAAAFAGAAPVKSYLTHDGAACEDRLTEEIGLFAGVRFDGATLRADFTALDAFKKYDAEEFDTLFELGAKAPASFGVSPVFTYTLAWTRQNGEEIPTGIASYAYDAACGDYLPVFDPSRPADSKTPLPCVRVCELRSIDFTDCPATNPGLWTARPPVDAPAKGKSPESPSTPPPPMSLHKQLHAKFSAHPAQFTRAIELHLADEKQNFDAIVSTIEREGTTAELATLRADLGVRDGELATLRAAATKHTEVLAAKEAKITHLEAMLAGFSKGSASGAAPVNLGSAPAEGAAATLTRAAWSALKPKASKEFIDRGGRLTD